MNLDRDALLHHLEMKKAPLEQRESMLERAEELLPLFLARLEPKGAWCFIDCQCDEQGLVLVPEPERTVRINSSLLGKMCKGSVKVALVASTLGQEIDQLIEEQSRRKGLLAALLTDSMASVMAEAAIGSITDMARASAPAGTGHHSARLSPGYGDFALTWQRDLFSRILEIHRIGISVDPETMLMSPRKSVTGIIGFRPISL